MLIATETSLSFSTLSIVLEKAIEGDACDHFPVVVKAYAMQVRPDYAHGEKLWSPRCIAKTFSWRVILKGKDQKESGVVFVFDDVKLRRACTILASTYPEAFGRIASGKPHNADVCLFWNFCLFGYVRFEPKAPKARKSKA